MSPNFGSDRAAPASARMPRQLYRLLLACTLAACVAPPAAAAPPSIQDYLRLPQIGGVEVSPQGTHLALITSKGDGRRQLAVVSLQPLGEPKLIAGFNDGDITGLGWINNDRLVFKAANDALDVNQAGNWGLYAINRDGSQQRQLIANGPGHFITDTPVTARFLQSPWRLFSLTSDGSADIIVSRRQFDNVKNLQAITLERLNTLTGMRRPVGVGAPVPAVDMLLDATSEPRVVTTLANGVATVHWRASRGPGWTPIAEFAAYGDNGFEPSFIDADGTLYVEARQERDTAALFRFDPAQKKMASEPLVALRGFDLNGAAELDGPSAQLIGIHYRMEQRGTHWFDPQLRAVQASVDAALPAGRVNRLRCGRCLGARFFVVQSSSDRTPGELYLLDNASHQLQWIGASRPWLHEAEQGVRSFHRVKARDGLPLPVYVTKPSLPAPGAGPLPAVVLVHGGPWTRGHDLAWDAEPQLLASRGYLVIEVEFRGSTGYGFKHFQAGWKQWGRAMQDDLADAAAWAAKEAGADAHRICIMGASFGGYAALMGPIRHRGVYRCAISFAGVTDVDLMYSETDSDSTQQWKRYGMPLLVGDRVADKQQLTEVSPLQQAARIGVPVLLAHGGLDATVPIEHSHKFRAAAERAGVEVEWLHYPQEAHGFWRTANAADYWTHVLAFLARALAAPDKPASAP